MLSYITKRLIVSNGFSFATVTSKLFHDIKYIVLHILTPTWIINNVLSRTNNQTFEETYF